jgi:two-component system nitrate/nitrite response regulator NarL
VEAVTRGHPIPVAVVDDDEWLLDSIENWLARTGPGLQLVATARSVAELLDGPGRSAKVVLLDLRLRDGVPITDNIRSIVAAGPVVVTCSARDELALIREAIRTGAHSYIRKRGGDPSEAREAIEAAAAGVRYTSRAHAKAMASDRELERPQLSRQEQEVLRLYASGLKLETVARRLDIKGGTAKGYLDRVREKYDQVRRPARTKMELRDRALEDGILPNKPPEP